MQTAQMVDGTILNGVRALNALRKGRPGAARDYANAMAKARPIPGRRDRGKSKYQKNYTKASKALASGYLEGIFGWAPLINDIRESRDAIMAAFKRKGKHYSITRKGIDTFAAGSYIAYGDSRIADGEVQIGSQQGAHYRIADSWVNGLNSLGLANVPATVWQSLPLSFVVDWFVSIGNFLEGLSAWHGLEFIGGYETTFVRGNYTIQDWSGVEDRFIMGGEPPGAHTQYFGMDRLPVLFPPIPMVSFQLPWNPKQWVIAAALLRQFT